MEEKIVDRERKQLEKLFGKLDYAAYQMECGKTPTIINIGSDECTTLTWALLRYQQWINGQDTEEVKHD